jgi:hypothetical protein
MMLKKIKHNYFFPNKTDNLFRHWYLCICVFINHFYKYANDHFGVFKKGNNHSFLI